MNLLPLFTDIKETFCSLWKYKVRGETLEIITPFTTPHSKFVSVFLTKRNDTYVITDGGWLLGGEYFEPESVDTKSFSELLNYFEAFYELRNIDHYGTKIFYKTTDVFDMIPNRVHDIAQFISQALTSYASTINSDKVIDTKEVENFRVNVDSYLKGIVGANVKFREPLDKETKSVKFNAIITQGAKVSLVKYVTGASFDYYRKTLSNASADFQIANQSKLSSYINNKIAIINDTAPGYDKKNVVPYINLLESHIDREVTYWSERERLMKIF